MSGERKISAAQLGNVVLALAGIAAIIWADRYGPVESSRFIVPPNPVATKPTADVVSTPSDTGRPPVDAIRVGDGFCGPNDDEGTFQIRFSLGGQLAVEASRRLSALPVESRNAMMRFLSAYLADGAVPEGVVEADLLLEATRYEAPPARLLRLAEHAIAQAPDDSWLQVARAFAAERLNDTGTKLDALRKARVGLPSEPAVGWATADLLLNTPETEEAIAGLDAYLAADPSPVITRMRARLIVQRDIQLGFERRTSEGVTLLWPHEALTDTQADGVLRAIAEALAGVARLIGEPRRSTLTAVVYPGQSELMAVTCVPRWATAVYDGTLRLAAMPAETAGVSMVELRHESTHAELRPVLPNAPQWFQEGLAQMFAGQDAAAFGAWKMMVRNRTWIPFDSLDGSFHVFDSANDADLAYAMSLALVELMQTRGGDQAMHAAVQAIGEGANTSAVLAQVCHQREVTGDDLLGFLSERLTEIERVRR